MLVALAMLGATFWLWNQTYLHYTAPPLALAILSLATVSVLANKIHPLAWLWWGAGLLTLFWSLTPSNTLVVGMWELSYLAAFAAGYWLVGNGGLALALLGNNLFTTLSLALAGLTMYFSGSAHFVGGAQALTLIPAMAALVFKSRWQLLAGLGLLAALYMALMSGSRAVYVPLLMILPLTLYRLRQEKVPLIHLAASSVLVAGLVATLDIALPAHPIQSALFSKATVEKQIADTSSSGSFGSRLQMWSQTLDMALQRPQGTGNGSFRDVLAGFQKFPSVNYSSPHNYYLETASTGGWLRLGLLLGLLGWLWFQGWKTSAWPYVLGSMGLWITLAFDITGMYPSVMLLAFASLGVLYGQLPHNAVPKINTPLAIPTVLVGLVLVSWWYWPCGSCAPNRHLGYRPEVTAEASKLAGSERARLLQQAQQQNPKSIWVLRIQLYYAESTQQKLAILNQLNREFPLAGPWFYLQAAETALELGQKAQAIQTLKAGLSYFPADFTPSGIPLGDSIYKSYEEWKTKAPALLRQLEAQ